MKKLITIIVLFALALPLCAQKQESYSAAAIRELSAKIEQLQHDNEFLKCHNDIEITLRKLNDLSHEARLATNDVNTQATIFEVFKQEYYEGYTKDYKNLNDILESYIQTAQMYKKYAEFAEEEFSFTETERSILQSGYKTIKETIKTVKYDLSDYSKAINAYKSVLK